MDALPVMHPSELTAHIEIRQALARYCRGLDRGDFDLICSAYHPGAMDRGRLTGDGPAEAFARFAVDKLDQPRIVGQHHLTNVLVELDGDQARVESYFLLYRPQTNPTTGDSELVPAGGRYLDLFTCRGGRWRIAERRVVMDWVRQPLPGSQLSSEVRGPAPGRREQDPSWPFLRRTPPD
ncbi:nuclear transport factor 2 family protein [Pseudorhodoferax sp.]|uniref:nuclear transport factor 2 family protein n=1 Tax=Pseudorhodoferax sp. TaxID=1993553 RepID=UPI0039E2C6C2